MENSSLFHRSFPSLTRAMDAGVVLVGAGLMAGSAQLQIPLAPVPVTLQTFALMVLSAALGSRRALMVQAVYLAAGLCGAPVFAGLKFGPAALIGPTGGYLLAFLPAAFLIGFLAERGWDRSLLKSVGMMLLGSLVIWLMGSLHLSLYVGGFKEALLVGALPFLLGDFLKMLVAAFCLPGLWLLVRTWLPAED